MNEFLIYLAYFLDNLHDLAGGIISILIPIPYASFITYPIVFTLTFFIGLKLYPRFIIALYILFLYLVIRAGLINQGIGAGFTILQLILPVVFSLLIWWFYKLIMKQNQKFIKGIFYFFSFLMIAFHGILLISHFNLQQTPRHEVTELKKPNTLLLSTIKKQNYTIDGKFFKSVNLIVDKEVQLYEDYKKFEKSFEEEASKLPTRLSKDKLINYDIYGYFVDCSYAKSYMSFRGLKIPEHPDFDRISNSFARIFVDNYYLKLGNYDNNRGSCSNDVYKNYLNKLKGELK
ncbi:hypothetical protein AVCANL279_08415 [Campylobacter canadensis]|uniref:hypothetical protein n=1 Tax=Campylobacter canadensis TaxID=449520 RepID=UPI0015553349|nr:hypothetical protein [Campylobacter canadensis]MBZ7997334.1 hypothetical protein [Campylobacter canadensis]MBZ8000557.1 hypothetical protein [Campylobacter canadensis]MBZ8002605.1 hypothetical protein [Campylobacter canadensis]MBZ8003867.1 hypothetical protein [Campylobacter canadensis]